MVRMRLILEGVFGLIALVLLLLFQFFLVVDGIWKVVVGIIFVILLIITLIDALHGGIKDKGL
jgi:hypothetical protein